MRSAIARLARSILLPAAIAVIGASPLASCAETPSQAELLARLTAARDGSDLTLAGLKPWHLKATFTIDAAPGVIADSGTLEEWWASPQDWRIQVVSTAYTGVLTSQAGKIFRSRSAAPLPIDIGTLYQQFTGPLYAGSDFAHAELSLKSKTLAGITLDQIQIAPAAVGDHHPDSRREFYFEPGGVTLRAVESGTSFIVRNRVGEFQHKSVAIQVVVTQEGKPELSASVGQLATFSPTPSEFQPAADQKALPDRPAHLANSGIPGTLLHKEAPVYPFLAREHHIAGVVLLKCVVGEDGAVQSVAPISSPSEILTTAAMTAVRQWHYNPYLFSGVPTSVEVTVSVHFNMN